MKNEQPTKCTFCRVTITVKHILTGCLSYIYRPQTTSFLPPRLKDTGFDKQI